MIISIANQKGGVGKTTTAVHLGHGLALGGFRACIIDTDPQGHVSLSLGLEKFPGLYRLLVEEEPLDSVAISARPKLDIVGSDKSTEKAKRIIASIDFRENVLADALTVDPWPYQVILIDLAPSLDVLQVAALAASDWLIIPTRLDHLAVDGVNEIVRSYLEIARRGGNLQGFSVLPTFFDRVTSETYQQYLNLFDAFQEHLWPVIPTDTKTREAAAHGQTLWEYARKSPALVGFESVSAERQGGYIRVLERLTNLFYGVEYGN
jgi:chromosome partitioning protein